MEITNEAAHHTFVRRADPFEPPVENLCARHSSLCSGSGQSHLGHAQAGDLRRRPFPRSLGIHSHNLGVHTHTLGVRSHVGPRTPEPSTAADLAILEDARRGAEQALRLVLEVLDRRRPAERMGKLFAPSVVESVRTIATKQPPGLRLGAASLRRVHVTRTAKNAAEVFGTYARGPRMFAVAARIEHIGGTRRPGWTMTSLRVN